MLTLSSKQNYSQQTSLFAVLLILACGLIISLFVRFLSHLKIVRGDQEQNQSSEDESVSVAEQDDDEVYADDQPEIEQSSEISEK